MSFTNAPSLIRGGIVLVDSTTGKQKRVIVLQYNPDSLTRTLVPQGVGADSGDRLETLRLKGPAIETIKLEAELDAADYMEKPDDNPTKIANGLAGDLAALEMIVNPSTASMANTNSMASAGTLEIFPVESDLAVFVWSKNRVVPVRITEFAITEEAFDQNLNPIRARVSLSLRILTVNDVPYDSLAASIFRAYHLNKEQMAATASGELSKLGIGKII
ncbi:MAG: hypothetical protein JST51_05750 [Armatimonadetes bacterium]|nr:hypothetical protein [Armatimonadota bacterium]